MRSILLFATALAAVAVSGDAGAQVRPGVFGYSASSSLGEAGATCLVFDCTPRSLDVLAGSTQTLFVNAPVGTPFAIFFARNTMPCAVIPGVANQVILAPPFFTVAFGVVAQQRTIRFCWDGDAAVPFPVPATIPVGFTFSTQAAALIPLQAGGTGPAFSIAISQVVR